jgi:hypothetical protein
VIFSQIYKTCHSCRVKSRGYYARFYVKNREAILASKRYGPSHRLLVRQLLRGRDGHRRLRRRSRHRPSRAQSLRCCAQQRVHLHLHLDVGLGLDHLGPGPDDTRTQGGDKCLYCRERLPTTGPAISSDSDSDSGSSSGSGSGGDDCATTSPICATCFQLRDDDYSMEEFLNLRALDNN